MSDLGEPAQSSNDIGQNTASAVPWQVSDALPSSCVGNAEFVPLEVVPESFSTQSWRGVDSKSRYLYWSDELSSGDGVHTRVFRWSLEQGITLVGEYSDAYLLLFSADGNAVVGSSLNPNKRRMSPKESMEATTMRRLPARVRASWASSA
jgi:hypothetical protein